MLYWRHSEKQKEPCFSGKAALPVRIGRIRLIRNRSFHLLPAYPMVRAILIYNASRTGLMDSRAHLHPPG